MGILDWITQPRCEELAPLAESLKDPLAHVLGPRADMIYPGSPHPPERLYVPRQVFMTPAEVQAAARLLVVHYKYPNGGLDCLATAGWSAPAARVRAFDAIREYGRLRGFDATTAPAATAALLGAFGDAAASKAGAIEAAVVYAAAQVVLESRTAALDAETWLPLWRWALGGPHGAAAVRTRVMAMKALQAIIRRGALRPAQVRAAAPMADVLRELVVGRAPSVQAAERPYFLAEADATVGAINFALAQAALAEGRPPGPDPLTTAAAQRHAWPWIAAGVAAVAVVGGVAYRRRRAA